MPFKVFTVNEILTAADVNDYLAEQAVATFAGTAARAASLGTPVEGQFVYLEDTDQLEVFDGSAWVSASNVLFGTAVPSDGQVVTYSTAVSGYVPQDASAAGGAVRNLLYNGAMQVAQRGTSETGITGVGYFTADRWDLFLSSLGTWTQTVEADGPTGSGFTKSLKMECTTADGSPAASSRLIIQQRFEGQDLQGVKKGTADAEALTLSFWVKSNVTGTYIAELADNDNSRRISASYTISASGTWEKKSITFPGDTTGAFDNDNNTSLLLQFYLAVGSDYSSGTLNTSWAGSVPDANRAVGQTNLAAATSNYWQVTGVQLETGTTASAFEHKPYGVELAECQRYYYLIAEGASQSIGNVGANNSTDVYGTVHFPVALRTNSYSADQVTGTNYYVLGGENTAVQFNGFTGFGTRTLTAGRIAAVGLSVNQGSFYWASTLNSAAYIAVDAEL